MEFKPVLRFAVTSDVHCKADSDTERKRFSKGMRFALSYAASEEYPSLDAVVVVGDFANHGEENEMRLFKGLLDELPESTRRILTMASHEYMGEGGEEGAHRKFASIFAQQPDLHSVINGFHFISVTTERGCRILDGKKEWLKAELKKAAEDGPEKPIFVFQHPHLSDTVYGSINWGEDDIISILMDYPQVIDFSGHSHAPVNDPRSIYQKHFTSFGTGSFSYFELDEFDKPDTVPEDAHLCAQYLIVEADAAGRVRVLPVDVLTEKFFNEGAFIEKPWEPDSFVYTDERYKTAKKPEFPVNAKAEVVYENGVLGVSFPQAYAGEERSDCYYMTLRNASGRVLYRKGAFSSYYLNDMPDPFTFSFKAELAPGDYTLETVAQGFWKNTSEKMITRFQVL